MVAAAFGIAVVAAQLGSAAVAAPLGVAALATPLNVAAVAGDVPYTILLDGRPLTPRSSGTGALARNGVVFVDVVVATKTFSGLLTFADAGNTVRLSIQHQTAVFRVGKLRAQFDGKVRVLPGAPFKVNGDIYIPLATVARLGGATLAFDRAHQVARLGVRPFASMLRQQAQESQQTQEGNPSQGAGPTASAASLSLTPSSSVDAQGALHVHLEVVNVSAAPLTLEFPNGGRVAFVVSSGGTAVWDSTRGQVFNMIVGFKTLAPKESVSYDAVWAQFGAQPAADYQLTARLMLRSPIVSRAVPVSLPAAPHPAAS
jgi:hypothetical protein